MKTKIKTSLVITFLLLSIGCKKQLEKPDEIKTKDYIHNTKEHTVVIHNHSKDKYYYTPEAKYIKHGDYEFRLTFTARETSQSGIIRDYTIDITTPDCTLTYDLNVRYNLAYCVRQGTDIKCYFEMRYVSYGGSKMGWELQFNNDTCTWEDYKDRNNYDASKDYPPDKFLNKMSSLQRAKVTDEVVYYTYYEELNRETNNPTMIHKGLFTQFW